MGTLKTLQKYSFKENENFHIIIILPRNNENKKPKTNKVILSKHSTQKDLCRMRGV